MTEVTLTQGPFQTEARRALHGTGWTDSFDRLERLISAQDIHADPRPREDSFFVEPNTEKARICGPLPNRGDRI